VPSNRHSTVDHLWITRRRRSAALARIGGLERPS
jgi:hypothetical protein